MDKFNKKMRTARKAAGLSMERAAAHAGRLLPDHLEFSYATVRRLEGFGEYPYDEENANPMLVWALTKVYGAKLSEISPRVAERLRQYRDLLDTAIATSRFSEETGRPYRSRAPANRREMAPV